MTRKQVRYIRLLAATCQTSQLPDQRTFEDVAAVLGGAIVSDDRAHELIEAMVALPGRRYYRRRRR